MYNKFVVEFKVKRWKPSLSNVTYSGTLSNSRPVWQGVSETEYWLHEGCHQHWSVIVLWWCHQHWSVGVLWCHQHWSVGVLWSSALVSGCVVMSSALVSGCAVRWRDGFSVKSSLQQWSLRCLIINSLSLSLVVSEQFAGEQCDSGGLQWAAGSHCGHYWWVSFQPFVSVDLFSWLCLSTSHSFYFVLTTNPQYCAALPQYYCLLCVFYWTSQEKLVVKGIIPSPFLSAFPVYLLSFSFLTPPDIYWRLFYSFLTPTLPPV